MKKIILSLLFVFFAFGYVAKAQEASVETRPQNQLKEPVSLRKMAPLQTINTFDKVFDGGGSKNELAKINILPLEMPNNELMAKIQLFNTTKPLTKTQIRLQKKAEKIASSKTGQWLIKKLAKAQLRKEFRKELRKVKGNKQAEQLLREKYAKKQAKLSGNLRIAVIVGIIGVILTLLPSDVLRLIGIICIIVALVFLLLHFL